MMPPPVASGRPSSSGSGKPQKGHNPQNYHPFRSKERPANKEKTQDLLCRVRYSNTMPEIPFDPKFLTCPFVDLSRYVEYKQTSLEKNYKHELLTEADLGVKIDLINPETYAIDYTTEVKLDPMDERLLEEDQINVKDQKRTLLHNKVTPWLRKTEYISSEYNRFGTMSDRQETKVGYNIKKLFKEENVYRDKDSQIEAINRTFDEAKKPVTAHYSKKGVVAVDELPILPDFELWRFPFAQVIFDSDPAPMQTPPLLQVEKMSQALIRGMMDESGEQFVAYFLPTDETLDKRRLAAAGSDAVTAEDQFDYKLSREYNWTVKNKASKGYEENYFLVFRDGAVLYNELETRVRLSRRRAKEGQPKIANSRLVVTHRDFNEAENGAQEERLLQLQHVAEEEEEEEVAEEGAGEGEEGDGEKEKEGEGSPKEGEEWPKEGGAEEAKSGDEADAGDDAKSNADKETEKPEAEDKEDEVKDDEDKKSKEGSTSPSPQRKRKESASSDSSDLSSPEKKKSKVASSDEDSD